MTYRDPSFDRRNVPRILRAKRFEIGLYDIEWLEHELKGRAPRCRSIHGLDLSHPYRRANDLSLHLIPGTGGNRQDSILPVDSQSGLPFAVSSQATISNKNPPVPYIKADLDIMELCPAYSMTRTTL